MMTTQPPPIPPPVPVPVLTPREIETRLVDLEARTRATAAEVADLKAYLARALDPEIALRRHIPWPLAEEET